MYVFIWYPLLFFHFLRCVVLGDGAEFGAQIWATDPSTPILLLARSMCRLNVYFLSSQSVLRLYGNGCMKAISPMRNVRPELILFLFLAT